MSHETLKEINIPTTKLLVVKIGDCERPATQQDITEMADDMRELLGDDPTLKVLVTHHAVNFEIYDLPLVTEGQSVVPSGGAFDEEIPAVFDDDIPAVDDETLEEMRKNIEEAVKDPNLTIDSGCCGGGCGCHSKYNFHIDVNGKDCELEGPYVTYRMIADFAGLKGDTASCIYMTNRRPGSDSERSGTLRSGQSVLVEDGMHFTIVHTNNA